MIENKAVIWQTENWNLVKSVDHLLEAVFLSSDTIELSKVRYKVTKATGDTLIASSPDGNGHILMVRTKKGIWLVAWATSDSIPDLTLIDLRYAAAKMA